MTVLVKCRADTPAERRGAAAAGEIATRVKDGVGVPVGVEILDPESLERSVGNCVG